MPHKITVRTNGQTLTVNASISHWTSEALALVASSGDDVESTTTTTITSDYDLWFANTATEATITVKQLDGTTLLAQAFPVTPGHPNRTLAPVPDAYQLASDSGQVSALAAAPAGALVESVSRNGTAALSNQTPLTSGILYLVGVVLPKGLTVTNITFLSGTTALATGTHQWFALYDKDRVLIEQTDNDTNTAWGANTAKTLALADPATTMYAGLHYVGINVTASTVPSLIAAVVSSTATGLTPKIAGTSTSSLVGTAPDPAAAITAAAVVPYLYLS